MKSEQEIGDLLKSLKNFNQEKVQDNEPRIVKKLLETEWEKFRLITYKNKKYSREEFEKIRKKLKNSSETSNHIQWTRSDRIATARWIDIEEDDFGFIRFLIDLRKTNELKTELPNYGIKSKKELNELIENESDMEFKDSSYCYGYEVNDQNDTYNPYRLHQHSSETEVIRKCSEKNRIFYRASVNIVLMFDGEGRLMEKLSIFQWLWQRRLFYRLKRIPFFKYFTLRKVLWRWNRIRIIEKFQKTVIFLKENLFIENDILMKCLIHIQQLSEFVSPSNYEYYGTDKQEKKKRLNDFVKPLRINQYHSSIPEQVENIYHIDLQKIDYKKCENLNKFIENHRRQLNDIYIQNLKILYKYIREIISTSLHLYGLNKNVDFMYYIQTHYSGTISSATNYLPLIDGDLLCKRITSSIPRTSSQLQQINGNKKKKQKNIEEQPLANIPTKLQLSQWRKFFKRIRIFLRLIDFYLLNLQRRVVTLVIWQLENYFENSFYLNSKEEFRQLSILHIPSSELNPSTSALFPLELCLRKREVKVIKKDEITEEEIEEIDYVINVEFEPNEYVLKNEIGTLLMEYEESTNVIPSFIHDNHMSLYCGLWEKISGEEKSDGNKWPNIELLYSYDERHVENQLEISSFLTRSLAEAHRYKETFKKYSLMIHEALRLNIDSLIINEVWTSDDYYYVLKKFRDYFEEISQIEKIFRCHIFEIKAEKFQSDALEYCSHILEVIHRTLPLTIKERNNDLQDRIMESLKVLDNDRSTIEEFVYQIKFILKLNNELVELNQEYLSLIRLFSIASEFDIKLNAEDEAQFQILTPTFSQLKNQIIYSEAKIEEHIRKHLTTLNERVRNGEYEMKVKLLTPLVQCQLILSIDTRYSVAMETIELFEEKCDELLSLAEEYIDFFQRFLQIMKHTKNKMNQMNNKKKEGHLSLEVPGNSEVKEILQKLFDLNAAKKLVQNLREIRELIDLRKLLWSVHMNWRSYYQTLTGKRLMDINKEDMVKIIDHYIEDIVRLEKGLPSNDILPILKTKIYFLKNITPTIISLNNPLMKERHYRQLYEYVSKSILENKELTLSTLLELGIHKHQGSIVEISLTATNENSLQEMLTNVIDEWKRLDIKIISYSIHDIYILSQSDIVLNLIDESLMMLSTIKSSIYSSIIIQQIDDWIRRLQLFSQTTNEWIRCQRRFLDLHPIFSASDIQRQLSAETKQFNLVEKNWKDTMRLVREDSNAIVVSGKVGLFEIFEQNNSLMDKIEKSLEEYLEHKRQIFPRFYFLSNNELIQLISKVKDDPTLINNFLLNCFSDVQSLLFHSESLMTNIITGMQSAEGEILNFSRPIRLSHFVEQWMSQIESSMVENLRRLIYDSSKHSIRLDNLGDLLEKCSDHSQIILTISCLEFRREVEKSIEENNLEKIIKIIDNRLNKIISSLKNNQVTLARHRRIAENLIITNVHQRDVLNFMCLKKVNSISNFYWNQQFRFHLSETNELTIEQGNMTHLYSYEFNGPSPRLVITSLTDRCFQSLSLASYLCLGGALSGPAGTGKTESIKEFAKILGRFSIVFNCFESVTYQLLNKLLSGMCQSSTWLCLDEFNRINVEVLSIISQQILNIKIAKEAKLSYFQFDSQEINLNLSSGLFITMNPTYSGRVELPDNLKALFRPISMHQPELLKICEILLLSLGFMEAGILSKKICFLFNICHSRLSNQKHYDFGLRAIKTIILHAGNVLKSVEEQNDKRNDISEKNHEKHHEDGKNVNNSNWMKISETKIIVESINDLNRSKLTENDERQMRELIEQVFSVEKQEMVEMMENKEEAKLFEKIPEIFHKFELVETEKQVERIQMIYKQMNVRHGIMLVGDSNTSKSTTRKILFELIRSSNQMDIEEIVINPKSWNLDELYGCKNDKTGEWNHGIFPSCLQECANVENNVKKKNEKEIRFLLTLDGPIDTLWVETLNSCLDDSKVLCLANSERIPLTSSIRLVFEVSNLLHASPATVSRCGVVYFDETIFSLENFVMSELKRLGELPCLPEMLYKSIETMVELSMKSTFNFLQQRQQFCVGKHYERNFIRILFTILHCFIDYLLPVIYQYNENHSNSFLLHLMNGKKFIQINRIQSSKKKDEKEKLNFPQFLNSPHSFKSLFYKIFIFAFINSLSSILKREEVSDEDNIINQKCNVRHSNTAMLLSEQSDDFVRDLFTGDTSLNIRLPTSGNRPLIDYFVDVESNQFICWDVFISNKSHQFLNIPCESMEFYRLSFLSSVFLYLNQSLLICGGDGCGKSSFINHYLQQLYQTTTRQWMNMNNFSKASYSALSLQQIPLIKYLDLMFRYSKNHQDDSSTSNSQVQTSQFESNGTSNKSICERMKQITLEVTMSSEMLKDRNEKEKKKKKENIDNSKNENLELIEWNRKRMTMKKNCLNYHQFSFDSQITTKNFREFLLERLHKQSLKSSNKFYLTSSNMVLDSSSTGTENRNFIYLTNERNSVIEKCVLFIDDVHRTTRDIFHVSEIVNSLKHVLEYRQIYSINDHNWMRVDEKIIFILSSDNSERIIEDFDGKLPILNVAVPSFKYLRLMVSHHLNGIFENCRIFGEEIQQLRKNLLPIAIIAMYFQLQRSIPAYLYDVRLNSLMKLVKSFNLMSKEVIRTTNDVASFFIHESLRNFIDMIEANESNHSLIVQLTKRIAEIGENYFKRTINADHLLPPNIPKTSKRLAILKPSMNNSGNDDNDSDDDHDNDDDNEENLDKKKEDEELNIVLRYSFLSAKKNDGDTKSRGIYMEYQNYEMMKDHVLNVNKGPNAQTNLFVPFSSSIDHINNIGRILGQQNSHGIVVGICGSGRRATVRFAANVFDVKLVLCSNGGMEYKDNEFRDDFKSILRNLVLQRRKTILLMDYDEIAYPSIIDQLETFMRYGTLFNLFEMEEMKTISLQMKQENFPVENVEQSIELFTEESSKNLHIILLMQSTDVEELTRLHSYILQTSTIIMLSEWSKLEKELLTKHFLKDSLTTAMENEDDTRKNRLKKKLISLIVEIYGETMNYCKQIKTITTKTTNKSNYRLISNSRLFITFVSSIHHNYNIVKLETEEKLKKLEHGLLCLIETKLAINQMRKELDKFSPLILKEEERLKNIDKKLEHEQEGMDKAKEMLLEQKRSTKSETQCLYNHISENQKILTSIIPSLKDAYYQLDHISYKDIIYFRSLPSPPSPLIRIGNCICLLLGIPESWSELRRLLMKKNSLKHLDDIDINSLPLNIFEKISSYLTSIDEEMIMKIDRSCLPIYRWLLAVVKFRRLSDNVKPKQDHLKETKGMLDVVEMELGRRDLLLSKLNRHSDEMKKIYDEHLTTKNELYEKKDVIEKRISNAHLLEEALSSEEDRWKSLIQDLNSRKNNLLFEQIYSSALITFMSHLSYDHRENIKHLILNIFNARNIDIPKYNFTESNSTKLEQRLWTSKGLPDYQYFMENMIILLKCWKWPLVVDPDGQAFHFLKGLLEKEKNIKLTIVSSRSPQCSMIIDRASKQKEFVILKDFENISDRVLLSILRLRRFNEQSTEEIFKSFQLIAIYHHSMEILRMQPSLSIHFTIINFSVTSDALHELILNETMTILHPDIEENRQNLLNSIAKETKDLEELEEKTLFLLEEKRKQQLTLEKAKQKTEENFHYNDSHMETRSSSRSDNLLNQLNLKDNENMTNLLDDDNLIDTLRRSMKTAESIKHRMVDNIKNEKEIILKRNQYNSLATRSVNLFNILLILNNLHESYSFSLNFFLSIFRLQYLNFNENKSENHNDNFSSQQFEKRITLEIFRRLNWMIRPEERLIASVIFAISIDQTSISHEEIDVLCQTENSVIGNVFQKFQLLTKIQYFHNLSYYYKEDEFLKKQINFLQSHQCDGWILLKYFRKKINLEELKKELTDLNEDNFRELEEISSFPFQSISSFHSLLFLRCISLKWFVKYATSYCEDVLDIDYYQFIETPSISDIFYATDKQFPIIFLLRKGTDSTEQFLNFVRESKGSLLHLDSLSLGEGQEKKAKDLLKKAKTFRGRWLYLQNLQLSHKFLNNLNEFLQEDMARAKENGFRLFLSINIDHEQSLNINQELQFIYKNSSKLLLGKPIELSSRISHLMKLSMNDSSWNHMQLTQRQIYISLIIFHSLIVERSKFKVLGWNRKTEFTDSDFITIVTILKELCNRQTINEEFESILSTLSNTINDIVYGGRLIDENDKYILRQTSNMFLNENLYEIEEITENDEVERIIRNIVNSISRKEFQDIFINFNQQFNSLDNSEVFGHKPITLTKIIEDELTDTITHIRHLLIGMKNKNVARPLSQLRQSSTKVEDEFPQKNIMELMKVNHENILNKTNIFKQQQMQGGKTIRKLDEVEYWMMDQIDIIRKTIPICCEQLAFGKLPETLCTFTEHRCKDKMDEMWTFLLNDSLNGCLIDNVSLILFLQQEIHLYNILLQTIHKSLVEMQKRISQNNLECSPIYFGIFKKFLHNLLPDCWEDNCYLHNDMNLSLWLTRIKNRVIVIGKWLKLCYVTFQRVRMQKDMKKDEHVTLETSDLYPDIFEIDKFFNPKGFFAALHQYLGKGQLKKLDETALSFSFEQQNSFKLSGIQVHNAKYDSESYQLIDCDSEYNPMPIVYCSLKLNVEKEDHNSVIIPLFRLKERNHKNNIDSLVIRMALPAGSSMDFNKWILRNVALVLQEE
ncbi:hypothetical protein SNEBB_009342 [Seison nebaliae]|nr:hypothetical protein SNEBB_009342 [Seison nebaliae]